MGKVIDFNHAKEVDEPAVLSATYYMATEFDGIPHTVELTGDEFFGTTCPICRNQVLLGFDEFISIMHEGGGLYGTMVLCDACTAKRKKSKE